MSSTSNCKCDCHKNFEIKHITMCCENAKEPDDDDYLGSDYWNDTMYEVDDTPKASNIGLDTEH